MFINDRGLRNLLLGVCVYAEFRHFQGVKSAAFYPKQQTVATVL